MSRIPFFLVVVLWRFHLTTRVRHVHELPPITSLLFAYPISEHPVLQKPLHAHALYPFCNSLNLGLEVPGVGQESGVPVGRDFLILVVLILYSRAWLVL